MWRNFPRDVCLDSGWPTEVWEKSAKLRWDSAVSRIHYPGFRINALISQIHNCIFSSPFYICRDIYQEILYIWKVATRYSPTTNFMLRFSLYPDTGKYLRTNNIQLMQPSHRRRTNAENSTHPLGLEITNGRLSLTEN